MSAGRKIQTIPLISVLGMVLAGSFASAVCAEDSADEILLRARKSRQYDRTAAEAFIAGLDLTDKQARQLLGVVDRAAGLHIETYEAETRFLPEMVEAFGAFAREDSLNQGFSPAVERRTARVNRGAREVREEIVERMLALEKEAAAILSEPQREYARAFKPGRPAAKRFAKLRKAAFRDERNKGPRVRRLADHRAGRNGGRNRRAAATGPLADARRQLNALQKQIYPQLSPIGRYLLHPASGDILCRVLGTRPNQSLRNALDAFEHGTEDYPASRCDQHKAEVDGLRAEINNWNLINGLHLSRRQIERIIGLHEAAQAQREAPQPRPKKRKARRDIVRRGARIAELERGVEDVLNPGQRQVLADYKSCLIPPKNLKNPVRVGQASDHSHLERWLNRTRRMSGPRLREAIDRELEVEAEHLGELSPADRQARIDLVVEVVHQAGDMSDVEFEISKAELAERIAPPDRIKELKKEINLLARRQGLPGKIARLMLKPRFIKQLRQRARQLADGVVAEPADLASGPQADNCDKGCAIKAKGKKKGRRRS